MPKPGWPQFSSFLTIALLLSILSFRHVVFTPGIVGHTWDWGIPPFPEQIAQHSLNSLAYLWSQSPSLGTDQSGGKIGSLFWVIVWLLAFLGGEVLGKLLIVATTCFTGLSFYTLARYLRFRPWVAYVTALLYMFSPVVYSRLVAGHLSLLLAHMFLPLFTLLLLRSFSGRTSPGGARNLVALALVIALLQVYHSIAVIGLVIFALAVALDLAWGSSLAQAFRKVAVVGGLFVLLNLYWIRGFVAPLLGDGEIPRGWGFGASLGTLAPNVEIPLRLQYLRSTSQPFLDAVRGHARPRMDTEFFFPPGEVPSVLWLPATFLVPAIASTVLVWRPRDRRYVLFVVVAFLGIILTSGLHTPLGSLFYQGLLARVPMLLAQFSNSNRFLPLTWLGLVALLGYALPELSDRFLPHWSWRKRVGRQWLKVGLALVPFLVLTYPFWSGNITRPLTTVGTQPYSLQVNRTNPEDRQVYDFLRLEKEPVRVAYLPPASYSYVGDTDTTYEWSSLYAPLPEFMSGMNVYEPLTRYLFASMVYHGEEPVGHLNRLLALTSTKYLIHPNYTRVISYLPLWPQKLDVQRAIRQALEGQKGLKPVPPLSHLTSVQAYENMTPGPRIFASSRVVGVIGNLDLLRALSERGEMSNTVFLFHHQLPLEGPDSLWLTGEAQPQELVLSDPDELVFSLVPTRYRLNPLPWALTNAQAFMEWVPLGNMATMDLDFAALLDRSTGVYTAPEAGEVTVEMPEALDIPPGETGAYEIILQLHLGPRGSALTVRLDGELVGVVNTKTGGEQGFRYVKVGSVTLTQGKHTLSVTAQGESQQALLQLVVVPRGVLSEARKKAQAFAAGKTLRMLLPWRRGFLLPPPWRVPEPGAYEARFLVRGESAREETPRAQIKRNIWLNGVVFHPSEEEAVALASDQDVWLGPRLVQVGSQLEPQAPLPGEGGYKVKLMELTRPGTLAPVPEAQPRVGFRQVNPIKYQVTVETDAPTWLVFNETFNPGWRAYVVATSEEGTFAEGSALLTWLRQRSNWSEITQHYPVNAYANGWLLGGVGTYHLLLLYQPQVWYEATLLVSGLTLLVCLAFLALSVVRRTN